MLRAGLAGKIVNIPSAARRSAFGQSAYSAAKGRCRVLRLGNNALRLLCATP